MLQIRNNKRKPLASVYCLHAHARGGSQCREYGSAWQKFKHLMLENPDLSGFATQ
ncbi:hypothetical protein [Prevotella sp. ne3005]|uniref:hypothetical protein n=1 Tax=Prevotella sp. ne3005 TaxID=1761887 RepID=UPI0014813852|nr:hypothetical protein [Prevotella sp. ne3005]